VNLVTGATGIIGSHVVLKLLEAGLPVLAGRQKGSDPKRVEQLFAYYTPDYKKLYEKIKWIEIDVRDLFSIEEALEGVSHVYHCAGYVSFDKRKRKKLFQINEGGTANIVNACLLKKVSLCHVSSVVTINNLDYKTELHEEVFWKTSGKESDYAISKYNAEREVWRGIEEGLNAVIVNPGVVLSPGFWNQSSSRIFSTCYKGNLFYTMGTAGLVSASDVANIMVQLSEKKQYANRYILIEGNYSYKELFDAIQENFGRAKPKINATRFVLQLGRIADGIVSSFTKSEPALTKAIINSALNKQCLSNQKIIKTLGYKFEPMATVIPRVCSFYTSDARKQGLTS
jgi:nucleoside-diphosphate-sugar epimerase